MYQPISVLTYRCISVLIYISVPPTQVGPTLPGGELVY